jgi:energy-coupling factor transporter ATP-binding protein EcfA2
VLLKRASPGRPGAYDLGSVALAQAERPEATFVMHNSPSRPERPIQSSAEDKLERSRFIERLASALVSPATGRSTGVVVGITGPWGSGKSSILNLLREHLKDKYPEGLVVSFDPWLVSGRNDLIAEFLGELIGTINANDKAIGKFKKLGATLAEYGAQLAPAGNLWFPGIGALLSGGFHAMKTALSNKRSLNDLRAKLIDELREIAAPIIVLIDEIDRVEDDEIRAVAQLVRSVADFPGISYVLAYDPDRVVQALGSGVAAERREEHGRGYLEKIVQLQIPLPVAFDDEITRLLAADLNLLKPELELPENFEAIPRYEELVSILIGDVISTPRDIRRLVDTFHVLAGMLRKEVDWIDLLAYSALMIKSPATVALVRREPDNYLSSPTTARGMERYLAREERSAEERLKSLVAPSERNGGTKKLLEYLFPWISIESDRSEHADALSERRPLLMTLRLGLLPGAFSRDEIKSLVTSSSQEVEARLRQAFGDGVLMQLVDRLDDLYVALNSSFNQVSFWKGVAAFAKKPDCEWRTSYVPMHEAIRALGDLLQRAVARDQKLRKDATEIFRNLRNAEESELTARWIRRHFFIHGLYGKEKRGGDGWFLDADQTKAVGLDMARAFRPYHLSGTLIPCHWDLHPVFTMIDTGVWDDLCRKTLNDALLDTRAFDGFVLMLFGGPFVTERESIAAMWGYDLLSSGRDSV